MYFGNNIKKQFCRFGSIVINNGLEMTKFVSKLIVFFCLCCFCCCQVDDVERALSYAGENRKSIEVALMDFENDEFKQAAMKYLIINSQYHYSRHNAVFEALKKRLPQGKLTQQELASWRLVDFYGTKEVSDIAVIDGDVLKENVDFAVDVWRSRPWANKYSFDEFCEYVLPYRLGDEPIEKWRKEYLDKYKIVYDSLCNDVTEPVEAARRMLTHIRLQHIRTLPELPYPHLGALYLLENKLGYCRDHCDLALYILRSLGIPCATDFYRESPSYNSRHFWTAVIDTLHRAKEFNLGERPYTWDKLKQRKKGKVYRQMFGVVDNNYTIPIDPFFTDRFIKDVSVEYGFENKVAINSDSLNDGDALYLSVFDGVRYKAIAKTICSDNKAIFKNIEPELVLFPTKYDVSSRKHIAVSHPVLTGDSMVIFTPNIKKQFKGVSLNRKYPLRKSTLYLENTVGMKISFIGNKQSYTEQIVDTPKINVISVFLPKSISFQYIELKPNENNRLEIAEIWAESDSVRIKPINAYCRVNGSTEENFKDVIMDDRWETCYISPSNGLSGFIDFGREIQSGKVVIIPRTDDNYIHPGDLYELFYHDGKRDWVSLGVKRASSSHLKFFVPENSVLLLKNHSRGKEERCFYMRDGIQIFP